MALKVGGKYWKGETPKRVERILKSIRRLIAAAMGTSYLTHNDDYMFMFLIAGTLIEEAGNFIGEEIKAGEIKRVTIDTPMEDAGNQTVTEEIIPPTE